MERSHNPRLHVLLALAVALTALLWPLTANAGWFEPERRLTTNVADQRWPEISGTKVAYEDYGNAHDVGDPNDPDTLFDIRVLDLKTGRSRLLTPYHTAESNPVISGDRVVWADYGHGSVRGGIYLYDLRTGVRRRLPIAGGRELRISGPRIVYEASPGGHTSIMVYNILTGRETRVTTDGASPSAADIDGEVVVWQDFRNGNFDIYAKDLATGITTRVTDDPASQTLPRVSGSKIVWIDERNGIINDDIYCYDLAAGVERQITSDPAMQWFPTISGDRIVWMDERTGDTEIFMYDLVSGVESRVTSDAAWSGMPSIAGRRIVYEDSRNLLTAGEDLYLSTVALTKVSATTPPAVDYDTRALVTGTLADPDRHALVGRTVTLESSADGKTWASGESTATRADGGFSLYSDAITRPRYLRVRFLGDVEAPGAVSAAIHVKPRVVFSAAPVASRYTFRVENAYMVWGYLTPKHRTGSNIVRVRAYRYQKRANGTWGYVYRTSFATILTNPEGSARSKYTALVRLPARGQWRLRAYHAADTLHAKTWSEARDVVVE